MAKKEQPEFVTATEAARLLGIGRSTIYLAIARGELVPIHPLTRVLRRADVERYQPKAVGAPKKSA